MGSDGLPTPCPSTPSPTSTAPQTQTASYAITAVSTIPLGATVHDGGASFGVWAPNADAVWIEGDFNSWTYASTPLAQNDGGRWSADVSGAVAGQEYMIVIQHGTDILHRADPRGRRMTNSSGHSILVDPRAFVFNTTSFTTPSFDQQVVYEMHIGTFNDQPGGPPGTWRSAIDRLDNLASLGVNMVEVMPPMEFAGDFSWGYNAAYPMAPESAYGTPEDMVAFVDAAHARGIGVILDVVHNHYGPSDLSMWCFDGECYGAGGIYFYTDDRRESGWGPRPDFGRVEVRDFIVDSALMWLNDYRVDGLRWDSTVNIRTGAGRDIAEGWGLLQRVNDAVDHSQPWKIMIAEDLQSNDWITRGTGGGGAGFDSQWDARFFHPIDDAIIASDDSSRSMFAIRDAITAGYSGDAMHRVVYTESHDEVANGRQRIPEMIYPGHADSWWSRKRSTLGAAIALTSPGIPMMFMGQEMLTDGYFTDQNPLDWSRADTYSGIVQMYTDLIRMRRNLDGNTAGLRGQHVNVFHVNDTDKVIAYHRWDRGGAGDDVVILANFSSRAFDAYTIGFPRGGTWHVRFNGDASVYSSDFGDAPAFDLDAQRSPRDGLGYSGPVALGPYSVVVLSQ
jgi:1,4-alpha-glucan branching enzyme